VKLDIRDVRGWTPLFYAVYRGDALIVMALVQFMSFEAVNTPDPRGETVLAVAARAGRADVLQVLLEHGAHEKFDELTRSPLTWAEGFGHEEVLRLLQAAQQDDAVRGPTVSQGPEAVAPKCNAGADAASMRAERHVRHDGDRVQFAEGYPEHGIMVHSPPVGAASPSARGGRTCVSGGGAIIAGVRNDIAKNVKLGTHLVRPATRDGQLGKPRRASLVEEGEASLTPRPTTTPNRSVLLSGQLPRTPRPRRPRTSGGGDAPEWSGNVGSLAVRWRCWAHATLVDSPPPPARPRGKRVSKHAVLPDFAEIVASAEATHGQIAKACDKVGGDFCTTCWEHVQGGHDKG